MDNPWATESPSWPVPAWPPAQRTAQLQDTAPWDAAAADDDDHPSPPEASDADWNPSWATTDHREIPAKAQPPASLDALLRHCQAVSQDIWPAFATNGEDDQMSALDDRPDIAALLAQLIPVVSTLPPTVQFSATATAKAMNEALKLTRHLPASASSPLSRLLASKGSLDWEKSIKAKQDIVPDTAHVGWRVLEKDDRVNTLSEESKPKKAAGSLLSFWNRRVSTIQAAPVETPRERSSSPARSSLESVKSASHPPSSRAASPSKAPSPPVLSTDSLAAMTATASAPSAVSRFLNRFSRAKGAQHSSLALSSDDIEFLSDIVPSASDPPDEDTNDRALDALTGASDSSSLPPKLPPPIPPPPKQPTLSSRPSSALGFGTSGVSVAGNTPTTFHTSSIPVLAPPPLSTSITPFSRTQSSPLFLKDVAASTVASVSNTSMQQRLQSSPQSNSRSHFTLPPPQRIPPSLSIPPLLPPPVSPPQTPRPSAFPSSSTRATDTSSTHDFYDSDDEFSAFTSFPPPSTAPFPSLGPYPSQGPPSPPSPPPRRTYERTHYPSSSSTSSVLSPASQSSQDQLCSTRSSVSASLDGFDDVVSPPPVARTENKQRTPAPPLLPLEPQYQHQQPPHIDTFTSRVYHAHTPSQTFTSPTVHTSLMNNTFPAPSVSNEEHQRTQTLVDQAAARGGILWPNSPELDEPRVKAIPPPPSTSMSPKLLMGEGGFDLLGDSDIPSGGFEALPAPLGNAVGSTVIAPMNVLRTPFGGAGGLSRERGSRDQLQSSPLSLPSTSAPLRSFSSLPVPLNSAASHPTQSKQAGGLTAQDLSFFEGL